MPNTPIWSLPYPALSDSPNVPTDMQALAEAAESAIASVDAEVAAVDEKYAPLLVNAPGCLLLKTANQSIPTGADTRIANWTTTDGYNDTVGGLAMADLLTGVVTIRETGVYDFEFRGVFGAGVPQTGRRILYITRNSAAPSASNTVAANTKVPTQDSAVGFPVLVRGRRRFTVGQTLHPVVWHNQGHDVDFRGDLFAGALQWSVQKVRA
ncbi:hypothetical protein [Prauserella flavalba]|uniref:hypothetical protein n=1 Tax=Prauserella flavalba TaxID=1477506 RepID=UPI0036ECA39A